MARGFGARETLGAAERVERDVYSAYYAKAGAEMADRLQALRREAEQIVPSVQAANNLRNNFFDAVKNDVSPYVLERKLEDAIKSIKEGTKYKFEVDAPKEKGGVPPLGAPNRVENPNSRYPEYRGSRADLATGKSTQEIKKMIVNDFKSKEAKEMGFLGVKSATASRSSMAFKIKTDLVPPASMKDKGRAYDVIVNAKSGASFINPPATKEEMEFAEKYRERADLARRIANAYDVDRSDAMTDYFDYRYMINNLTLTDKDGNDIV